MIYRSPFPDIRIPTEPLAAYVLDERRARAESTAFADASTGQTVTYGQLRDQVRKLAVGLSERGIVKGDVVALYLGNCPQFAVALHAVVTLGAIITPTNPLNTAHDLALQLRGTRAKMLVTIAAFTDKARDAIRESGLTIELVTVEAGAGTLSLADLSREGTPPRVSIDPATDIAVLPYSSGTTGLPKAVMLTHRNLVANLAQIDAVEHGEVTGLIAVLPFFHIYGMIAVLNFGLLRGLTLVTLPRFELEPFLKALQDWKISHAHIVPPIAVALAKHPAVDAYDLSHLREVFSGAAPLGADITLAVQRRLKTTLKQGYGMTEASPVTHYTDSHRPLRPGTVGQPAPLTECRIVDVDSRRDAQPGEPGEVWIRGPQVMKGYLDNPEATAQTLDADGWLHTGDIGTVDSDGYLTIVDRLKELIKVKGYQVAPAELEALLLKHPRIADAAVIPSPDEECGEVPRAIVVPRGELAAQEVFDFVNAQVSPYKRIRQVQFAESIPKSASGKILRRVLVEQHRQAS